MNKLVLALVNTALHPVTAEYASSTQGAFQRPSACFATKHPSKHSKVFISQDHFLWQWSNVTRKFYHSKNNDENHIVVLPWHNSWNKQEMVEIRKIHHKQMKVKAKHCLSNAGSLVQRCVLVTLWLRRLRQDHLEAKRSYVVRCWLNKSGMCLSSDTSGKKKIIIWMLQIAIMLHRPQKSRKSGD